MLRNSKRNAALNRAWQPGVLGLPSGNSLLEFIDQDITTYG
jgi:hypothetical protein